MEPSTGRTSTLPSSRSYADWAASCPEVYLDFGGKIGMARAKCCAFCGVPTRLSPRGDQALVEHMKSNACKNIQRQIEDEITGTAEIDATGAKPDSSMPNLSLTPGSQQSFSSPCLALVAHTPASNSLTCEGAEIILSCSSWANYPWHLHDPSLNRGRPPSFYPCGINCSGDVIRIRSSACVGVTPSTRYKSCIPCTEAVDSREVQSIIQRMENESPPNGLNLVFYSHKQLADVLESKEETLKKYRLQGLEVNRKATRLLGKLSDYKQLLLALSEVDDVAVSRIVQVALRQGCGPAAIVGRLMKAQQGLYRSESYSGKDIDIGLLVLRLGGPRLLESLSKALNLPSSSTIYRHAERLHLWPSIAFPTENEVLKNIESICGHAQAMNLAIRGFNMLIDEIALEERIRYSLAEDILLGFCRECTTPCQLRNMTGRPISDLYALKKLLDSGKCHRAKEATVIAVAPFGPNHYTPLVFVISGTCKTENVDRQLALIKLAYNAYKMSPHGATALGPIWSLDSDGDAARRLALFRLCTSRMLSPPSELYLEIGSLELMNLACGDDEITHNGDFKHEEKRFASALRSGTGVYVNGMHISPAFIKQLLRLDPAISSSRLDALFDNSDRQNVPKAHALLKGIYDVSQLPDIQKQPGHKPFILLGELLHAFISPYTTPSMSLSRQVVCLAKCAFLLFALFRLDGTRFITSQLYYDIQTTVKTAVFSIAKAQILDPMQPFYLIQLGTDRLENLFGIYRTASHDRNLDILQLAERSSAAQEVDNILAKYPGYDRKPYRLSLEGASGVDHLNPRSWTGDVRVCNVNLRSSWTAGRVEAEEALRRAGIEPDFNQKNLRVSAGGLPVDLMRPFGHYVGVSESIPEASDDLQATASTTIPDITATGLGPNQSASAITNPTPTKSTTLAIESGHFSALDFTNAELDAPLEDLLSPPSMPPGTSEHDTVQTANGSTKRGWVKIDQQFVRLESAARLIFGAESTEKSTDRLRRVRGYTRYPSLDDQSDSILGDICLIGQPILALVRVGDSVALAAARVVSIQVGSTKTSVESISLDHLNRSDITFTAQILQLDLDSNNRIWYWNQSYVTSPASKKGKQTYAINEKPLLVQFHSRTIELVNPILSEFSGQLVWSFKHDELLAAIDLLWSKCSESLHEIPDYSELNDFPYRWGSADGQNALVHDDASQAIESMPTGKCGVCYICSRVVPIKQCMRIHVAKHILARRYKMDDPLLDDGSMVVGYAPCGFCGRSGAPECRATLKITKRSTTFKSGCPFYDNFSHKAAGKPTVSGPCTNRPLRCEYSDCSQKDPIWSYNMREHILARHGQSAHARAINEGQYLVSEEEIRLLQLDNMFIIPGRHRIVLHDTPNRGAKRPLEASTANIISDSPLSHEQPIDSEARTVASGSAPKRAKTTK
ncbi:hypothetical protein RSOLAG22IIIB_05853 [Rhizoctonia solani]|uniref:Uncharacterized protein n=1 Tax=Rhizoctonia solani TaxID=456999 RepID=A0A0K6G9P9_9AGAM|nr:hypothetical protein RSOLAG22IIIB_05853 [Rhizoctonia solani]